MTTQPETRPSLPIIAKIAIYVAIIVCVVSTFVCVIGIFAAFSIWMKKKDLSSFAILFGSIVLTGALIWLAVYLHSLVKKPEIKPPYCQCCGTVAPTIRVNINRHIGALLLMFHKSIRGYLCKLCIRRNFWEYTTVTLFLGWWGLVSLAVTPIVLINNIVVFIRSFFMPVESESPVESVIHS
jgi:hypothetical protein